MGVPYRKHALHETICVVCEAPFMAKASHATTCSDVCRAFYSRWNRRGLSAAIARSAQLAGDLDAIRRMVVLLRARGRDRVAGVMPLSEAPAPAPDSP